MLRRPPPFWYHGFSIIGYKSPVLMPTTATTTATSRSWGFLFGSSSHDANGIENNNIEMIASSSSSLSSSSATAAATRTASAPNKRQRKRYFYTSSHNPTFLRLRGGGGNDDDNDIMNTGSMNMNLSSKTNSTQMEDTTTTAKRVYIAVGSNMGNRYKNIQSALTLLCQSSSSNTTNTTTNTNNTNTRLIRTSFLYETIPMYLIHQPKFLNGVVEIETFLSPKQLLLQIKKIENLIGRDTNKSTIIKNGPRPVDLDILFYDVGKLSSNHAGWIVNDHDDDDDESSVQSLIIPHPSISERDFVLTPLCDLHPNLYHPQHHKTVYHMKHDLLLQQSKTNTDTNTEDKNNDNNNDDDNNKEKQQDDMIRVIPLPRGRFLRFPNDQTLIMGILNVTPDSFSDGNIYIQSIHKAVQHAINMMRQGATIIDIGGESTRPGAKEVDIEEELKRTIPVIRQLRQESEDIIISIDTRHSIVAKEAIAAGADIVNDVSAGIFDPNMFSTVSTSTNNNDVDAVPMILMHMRGTPETMQQMTQYNNNNNNDNKTNNIIQEIAQSLLHQSNLAQKAGIHKWMQILDPGIGFSKSTEGNLILLKHIPILRKHVYNYPLLIGPSRKGFIGKITGEMVASERDYGTAAACIVGLSREENVECTIVRVHNVIGIRQALMIMDAIKRA